MTRTVEAFYTYVGQQIRAHRIRLGFTQEQLGRLLAPATSRVSIANVESGKQRILSHTLVQFAEALRIEALDLLPNRMVKPPFEEKARAIADELVLKAGLSRTNAKKLVENHHAFSDWKEKKP